MAKCNLAPELRDEYLMRKDFWTHGAEELEECRAYFDGFLFCDWTGNWADPDNDIMDGKPGKEYRCTACGERFYASKEERPELFRRKHNDTLLCPNCGRGVTIKHLGKVRQGLNLSQRTAVTFINVAGDGAVCLESGIAFYDYNCERDPAYADMDITFIAKRRYYMAPGTVMEWRRDTWAATCCDADRSNLWEEAKTVQEPFQDNALYGFDGFGYLIGLDKLEKSQLKYSAIVKYFEDYHNLDITQASTPVRLFVKYMAEYALNNRLEMAVKLGLCDAVGELVRDGRKNARDINWEASSPAAFARLGKEDAKEFYKDPSLVKLNWYHKMQKLGAVRTMREAEYIAGHVGFCSADTAAAAGKYGLRLYTLADRMGDVTTLSMWTDYIGMAEKLDYDLTRRDVLLPKNLRERHDAAAAALKIKGDLAKDEAYQKRRKKLEKKYGYTCDGLKIIVPAGIDDIVREGRTLKICVGGYADRHVEGKTTILFLRHARRPERSWLCIELDGRGEIRQIHGYKNEGYRHSANPRVKYAAWLEQWQGWYKGGSPRDKEGRPIIKINKEAKTA